LWSSSRAEKSARLTARSTTAPKHTLVEWLAFLQKIHRKTPPELALHLIVDNYSTHKPSSDIELTFFSSRSERRGGWAT
jgi:hypothetical protein